MKNLRLLRIALGLLAVSSARSARAQGDPAVRIENPVFDFGSVAFGKTVSHAFVVKNQGGSPLLVQEVLSKCDCFHATFDKAIAPGQAGRIQTTVDTSSLEGPVLLTAVVRSNDPARRAARFEIKGFVKGPIMLLPRDHVDMTTVAGENQEQEVLLEVNRKGPLKVRSVDSTSAVFIPQWKTSAPGRRYQIVVKAIGSQTVGLHRGTIRIHTDDEKRSIIPVECSLLVVSSVVAEPNALYLPPLDQQEARKGIRKKAWKVVVRNLRNRPFNILSVDSDLSIVQAWSEIRPDGTSHDVFVEIRPNELLQPGRTITSLHVKTDLPDAQDVKIPVWVEVR